MKTIRRSRHWPRPILAGGLLTLALGSLQAQVPQIINYHGQVAAANARFDGTGYFKFALVNAAGDTTYWSHNGTSTGGVEPADDALASPVSMGRFSVALGDTAIPGMTQPISPAVFLNNGLHLRVWFSDGQHPFERLAPDLRLASVGYALTAATVPDGAITAAKLADGAVTEAKIAGNIPVGKISGLPDLQTNLVELTQAYSNYTALLNRLNAPPLAEAGSNRVSMLHRPVALDASTSRDPNGNPLTWSWSFLSLPPESAATLSGPTSPTPTFTPDLQGNYVLQLIVNDGLVNSPPDTVAITAKLGLWVSQQTLVFASEASIYPVGMAADQHDRAVLLYGGSKSSVRDPLRAATYDPAQGWSAGTTVAPDLDYGFPRFAMGRNGTAFAVWSMQPYTKLMAARYTPTGGWETPQLVNNPSVTEYDTDQKVAVDDEGNAVVVWCRMGDTQGGFYYHILGSRFTGGAWGTPQAVSETSNDIRARGIDLGFDAAGNLLVVWYQWNQSGAGAWANRMSADGQWGQPAAIPGAEDVRGLAVNRSGKACLVWERGAYVEGSTDIVTSSLYASTYEPETGWSVPTVLFRGDASKSAVFPNSKWETRCARGLDMDPAGNVLVAFITQAPYDPNHPAWLPESVYAIRFAPGTGWVAPLLLAGNVEYTYRQTFVKADDNGNAFVAWDDSSNSKVLQYVAGTGWDAVPQTVAEGAIIQDLAVSPGGVAFVSGVSTESGVRLWVNWLRPGP